MTLNVAGDFDGDLIRPLGWLTLNFGYAEAEINGLLKALAAIAPNRYVPQASTMGQKVGALRELLESLPLSESKAAVLIVLEGVALIQRRNLLIHACVLSRGRIVPSDKTQSEFVITPEELTKLADDIFSWKERLAASIQRQLIPAIQARSAGVT